MNARRLIAIGVLACGLVQGPALASQVSLLQGDRAVIANEGTIGDKWMLADDAPLPMAGYPAGFVTRGDDVCLAIGYRIGEDGSTSDFAVLKQWNSAKGDEEPVDGYWQAFAEAGANALSQWKFKPRPETRVTRETYTVATMAFTGTKTVGGDTRSHCQTRDLAGLIQESKARYVMDYSRERRDLDRATRTIRAEEIRRNAARASWMQQHRPPPPPPSPDS